MTDYKHIEEQIARLSTGSGFIFNRNDLSKVADTMQAMLDVVRAAEGFRMAGRLGTVNMDTWEVFRDRFDALDKLKAEKRYPTLDKENPPTPDEMIDKLKAE